MLDVITRIDGVVVSEAFGQIQTSSEMTAKPVFSDDLDRILKATGSLWEEVRGQRIFISGGTGFFGCWLLESFCHINQALGLDAHVTVLTRNPQAFASKCPHLASDQAITLHAGDVRSFGFPEGRFRYFIHAATEASARQSQEEPLEMLTTILAGTERALSFAATHGTEKFLLTSSGAVYGKQPSGLTHVSEDYPGAPDPLDPASVYSEGKRTSELMCALYQKTCGIQCKIARCWAFVGPHLPLDTHFAIGNFIRDAIAGTPIHIQGDGTPHRSYLYAADLAIWLWTILFRGQALRPYNVGSEVSVSILDLAKETRAALRPDLEIVVDKQPKAGAPVSRYVPATLRAREELGLTQSVGLQEAIQRTAEWYGPCWSRNL
jgi:nucleoside-diphosphate-sugar epimerase